MCVLIRFGPHRLCVEPRSRKMVSAIERLVTGLVKWLA